jgi:hypothetical protein
MLGWFRPVDMDRLQRHLLLILLLPLSDPSLNYLVYRGGFYFGGKGK